MKLKKELHINSKKIELSADMVCLDIDRPGRAIFTVLSPESLEGTVTFAFGWNFEEELTALFTGEIYESIRVDDKRQKLVCREISARLDKQLPASLRHPTLQDVLKFYSDACGLPFLLPNKPYAKTKVPAFYSFGSGFSGMASLGEIFSIPDYIWITNADGTIFVGSWADSPWADGSLLIPDNVFTKSQSGGVRTGPAVPGLRPGCVMNGQRVKSVTFSGHTMEVTPCRI